MTSTWIRGAAIVGACLVLLPQADAASPVDDAAVYVTYTGFRSDRGTLLAEIFNRPDGFPTHPERALRRTASPVHHGVAHVSFDDLAPGEYAVVAFHDENDNRQLDKNWMGVPIEGIAVSNDAPHLTGPPRFEDARFPVPDGGVSLRLSMEYH